MILAATVCGLVALCAMALSGACVVADMPRTSLVTARIAGVAFLAFCAALAWEAAVLVLKAISMAL